MWRTGGRPAGVVAVPVGCRACGPTTRPLDPCAGSGRARPRDPLTEPDQQTTARLRPGAAAV